MSLNDSFHNRQPYARPAEILYFMQSLEHAKQFSDVLHLEPNSIVGYTIHDFMFFFRRTDFDLRIFLFS
jgi:hypothetical protein